MDEPCCGACAHAIEVEARGGPRHSTAPLLHAPVHDGVPRGVTIAVVRGRDLGRTVPIDRTEIVVGRSRNVDFRLEDYVISRRQCRFVFRDEHVYVEDLDSVCGTYVDDAKVRSAPLRNGQRVHVGDTIFLVQQVSLERLNGRSRRLPSQPAMQQIVCAPVGAAPPLNVPGDGSQEANQPSTVHRARLTPRNEP